jgi:hypothetical protein
MDPFDFEKVLGVLSPTIAVAAYLCQNEKPVKWAVSPFAGYPLG